MFWMVNISPGTMWTLELHNLKVIFVGRWGNPASSSWNCQETVSGSYFAMQQCTFCRLLLTQAGMKISRSHSPVKGAVDTSLYEPIWHKKSGMDTQLQRIKNMPCSNQFGKKASSYSILKTSQWKVTVCPFIDKDQHWATCAHTHSHTPKRPHKKQYSHTHLYKMLHDRLTITLQYRNINATAFSSFQVLTFGLNQKYIAGIT